MSSAGALTTADVATAADGAAREIPGLEGLSPASSLCGPAVTCRCAPGDNLALHGLLYSAPAGAVLVCDAGGRRDAGYFGELMATEALNRGLAGLVLDGAVRDGAALLELGFPVFHRGFAPGRCAKSEAPSIGKEVELAGIPVAPGDQIVADRDAVVVVSRLSWPAVEVGARALRADEAALRTALARGERLAELIGLAGESRS